MLIFEQKEAYIALAKTAKNRNLDEMSLGQYGVINCAAVVDLLFEDLSGDLIKLEKRFTDINAIDNHVMFAQNTIVSMGLIQQQYARVRVYLHGILI